MSLTAENTDTLLHPALGEVAYLHYCTRLKVDPVRFDSLNPAIQSQWATHETNGADKEKSIGQKLFEFHAATTGDPWMPGWATLPYSHRLPWEMMGEELPTLAPVASAVKPSEAHEELRKMRQYSKCFTNAYDRKQMVFVLVEQDETAWKAIAQWVVLNAPRLGESHAKIIAAKAILSRFMKFEAKKLPD